MRTNAVFNFKWSRETLSISLIAVWSLIVFGHYFSPRSTFDLSFVSQIISDLRLADKAKFFSNIKGLLSTLLLITMVVLVLWRWGRKLFGLLGLNVPSRTVRFCLEMACGILFLNLLWLGLGLVRLWFEPLLLTMALGLLGYSFWDYFQTENLSWSFLKRRTRIPSYSGTQMVLAGLALSVILLGVLQAMAPETYFDALVYHLSTLDFWMFHHGICDYPGNLYSHYPFGAEFYFLNGFYFGGGEAVKLLNLLAAILCAIAAAGWVNERKNSLIGWTTGTLILVFPLVSATVWAAQNDVFMALFFLLFVYSLGQWAKSRNGRWLWLTGMMGGGFLTVKYTAVLGIAAAILALILARKDIRKTTRPNEWILLSGIFLFSILPWLMKNFVFAGNFFYPYFSHLFGGSTLSSENMNALLGDHEAPFHTDPSVVHWAFKIFTQDLNGTIGPVIFSFLPFLFLPGRRDLAARYLLVLTGFYLFLGFMVSHQPRLMIPGFLLAFVAMGLVISEITSKSRVLAWAWIVIIFGLLSVLSLVRHNIGYYHTDRIALGVQTREEYLRSLPQTASYFGLTEGSAHFSVPEDRILIVGDARSLYYSGDICANSVFDDQILSVLARKEKDVEGIYKRLRQMGIDELAVSGEEGRRLAGQYASYYPLRPVEWKKLDDLIQQRTDLFYLSGVEGIYRLRPSPAGRKKPIPDLLLLLKTQNPNP